MKNGAILPLLRRWREASDSGDRAAAVEIETAVVGALSPPDDGTGEARAEIAHVFVKALESDTEEGARRILDESRERLGNVLEKVAARRDDEARVAVPVPEITGEYPNPVLSLAGCPGAVLSEGSVAILSGAGGTAKSALVLHQALAFAMAAPATSRDGPSRLHGGIFDVHEGGGAVLYLSHENEPTVARAPLVELARIIDNGNVGAAHHALRRIHVLGMMGRPLFGPTDRGTAAGLYNARPGPLAGWRDLVRAIESICPRLVIVDPVLAAYVGDSNSVPPVREFLGPLACLAGAHRLGIVLVAHSNKTARKAKNADPLDPGHVGGSGHWFDTVRGVLVLNRIEERPDERVLACPKSNRGPDRLLLPLKAIVGPQGQPLGLSAVGKRGWRGPPPKGERTNNRNTANGRGRQTHPSRQFAPGIE